MSDRNTCLRKAGANVLIYQAVPYFTQNRERDYVVPCHSRPEAAPRERSDPAALFAPLPELRARVQELLKRTGPRPGHIVNVGHGILPETPVDNVRAVVDMVREFRP